MKPTLATILADSLSSRGVRLTTFKIRLPRYVLAEFNTHRMISKSAGSSRAKPTTAMVQANRLEHFEPVWGRNGSGMQAAGDLDEASVVEVSRDWSRIREDMCNTALAWGRIGVAKQHVNRLLELHSWHTVIASGTEWDNFFNLRCNPAAAPEIRDTAEAMRDLLWATTPTKLAVGEWHTPFINDRDADLSELDRLRVSVARCARVSYNTHEGVRDPAKDIELHNAILVAGHMAPFEHVARELTEGDAVSRILQIPGVTGVRYEDVRPDLMFVGNYRGWMQYRKGLPDEADPLGRRSGE